MIAYYADPNDRKPFWREREDDGAEWVCCTAQGVGAPLGDAPVLLRRPSVLHRHLLTLRERDGAGVRYARVPVYIARDDSAAHWQIFLLVAGIALIVAIKALVEQGASAEEPTR